MFDLTELTGDLVLEINTPEAQRRWLAERSIREYERQRTEAIDMFFAKKQELRLAALYASAEFRTLEEYLKELPAKITIAGEKFRKACEEYAKYDGVTPEQVGKQFDEKYQARVKKLK